MEAMDYRAILKRLEKTAEKIENSPAISLMVRGILDSIVQELGKEFGISGGRIYEQANSHYQLIYQTGDSHAPENYTISVDYPIIQKLKSQGQTFTRSSDPIFDPAI